MKRYLVVTAIVFMLVSVSLNTFLLIRDRNKESDDVIFSYSRIKESMNLPLAQSASCSFQRDMSVTFPNDKDLKDRMINFKLNTNKQPINISFLDLDTDSPKMRGNGGQSDIVKLIDTEDVVTVVEKDPILFGTLQSFSIFKKTGVGIWTKQYDLIGTPFGLVSMGYCD